MKSRIEYFRQDYEDAHLGQSMDDVHDELDKCEARMLAQFDGWRKGKKIISAIPKRVVHSDVNQPNYVTLTVLYESK